MTDLSAYLETHADAGLATAIARLAGAATRISAEIRAPQGALDAVAGDVNADGDTQKALDVLADEIILEAARDAGAAAYMSEERAAAIPLAADGDFIIASDPLDGSSNIGVNVSIGTIFSVLPTDGAGLINGRRQLAAGFFVYGPQTTLLVTVGAGVASFRMNADGDFRLIDDDVRIPEQSGEFAINTGNQRHWLPPVQRYIADCVAGADGPRGRDFSQRYVGALVAELWRIFCRGGVFLYPADCGTVLPMAGCALSMRRHRWPCLSNRQAGAPPMLSGIFSTSPRQRFTSGCRLSSGRARRLTRSAASTRPARYLPG